MTRNEADCYTAKVIFLQLLENGRPSDAANIDKGDARPSVFSEPYSACPKWGALIKPSYRIQKNLKEQMLN